MVEGAVVVVVAHMAVVMEEALVVVMEEALVGGGFRFQGHST